jgi:hypothetical protein
MRRSEYNIKMKIQEIYNPSWVKRIFSKKHPDLLWGPPSFRGSFLGVKRQGRKVYHSPNAEAKNEWSYTLAFPIRFHGMDRGNLPFYLYLKEIRLGGVAWIHLAENRYSRRTVVETVMNIQIQYKAGNFLTAV